MKVSFIYRIALFFFLGFAVGTFITAKTFIRNIPPTTQIEIGKVKVKGKGNTVESVMNIDDVTTTEDNSKLTWKEKRKIKKNK